MPQELTALARRCLDLCDEAAWSEFVPRIEEILDRFLRRRLLRGGWPLDRDRVEELRQEVFCRLLDRDALSRCRALNDPQLLAYLKTICDSVVNDRLRRRSTLKRTADRLAGSIAEDADLLASYADPAPDPEQRLLEREGRRRLRESCRRVLAGPNARRDLEIFELAVIQGWSSREIRRLHRSELSIAGIDSIVYRLRRRLRALGVELPQRHTPRPRTSESHD